MNDSDNRTRASWLGSALIELPTTECPNPDDCTVPVNECPNPDDCTVPVNECPNPDDCTVPEALAAGGH